MTYVLGSRCSDGVVIVGDTKFTITNGPTEYMYDIGKVTGEQPGIISAFAGTRAKFERFRSEIREFVSNYSGRIKDGISVDRVLIEISNIIERTSNKFDGFELLVGISGVYFADKKSILKHFYTSGGYVPINGYKAIGSEAYGKVLLRNWRPEMTMKQIAELGYFVIRYIQELNLDEGVGIDEGHPVQVTFIPDKPTDKLDYPADKQMLDDFEERTKARLNKIDAEPFFSSLTHSQ